MRPRKPFAHINVLPIAGEIQTMKKMFLIARMKVVFVCLWAFLVYLNSGAAEDSIGVPKSRKFSSSYPILSGSVFRDICQHKLDDGPIDPASVKEGDIIFVRGRHAASFFAQCHLIPHKFMIISHLTAETCPGKLERYLNTPNLVAWFGKNACGNHPKLHQLPIGVYQGNYPPKDTSGWEVYEIFRRHLQTNFFENAQSGFSSQGRPYLLSKIFSTHYNIKDRKGVENFFKAKPYCASFSFLPYKKYCQVLQNSSFVLSPRGGGEDCFRTWEAMLSGAYPIIKSSFLDSMYKDLPVVIIKNWEEVTQPFLENKLVELSRKPIPLEKLYADYWIQKIIDVRNKSIPDAETPLFLAPSNPYLSLKLLPYKPLRSSLSFAQAYEWITLKGVDNVVITDHTLAIPLARALPSYGHVILVTSTVTNEEQQQFLSNVLHSRLAQNVVVITEEEWLNTTQLHDFPRASLEEILSELKDRPNEDLEKSS